MICFIVNLLGAENLVWSSDVEVKIKTRALPLSRNLHATSPVIRGVNNEVFALVIGGQSCSKSDVFDDVFKINLEQTGSFYTGNLTSAHSLLLRQLQVL